MKDLIIDGEFYVSPSLEVLTLESEGVLCQSGETEDYNQKDFIM